MIGDLLLGWISKAQSGSISSLRETVMWAMRSIDTPVAPTAANRWIRTMSQLGHVEVDWFHDRWSIAPAVMVRLPHADMRGVVTGGRDDGLVGRLEQLGFGVDAVDQLPGDDVPLPAAVFLQFRSARVATEQLASVGLGYGAPAGEALVDAVPRLMRLDHGAPPATGVEVDTFDVVSHEFQRAPRRDEWGDGLYRSSVQGRPRHVLKRADRWLECELSAGIYLELKRTKQSVLRWRPDFAASPTGSLVVDDWAHLPELAGRALVLCSGLAAIHGQRADTLRYQNVPRSLAGRIAAALHQDPLEIV